MSIRRSIIAAISTCFAALTFISAAHGQPRQNERFVLRSVRVVHGAEMTYSSVYGAGNYGTIADLANVTLIDTALASGIKYGYIFSISRSYATATTPGNFVVTATPWQYGKTGKISYFIDSQGEIHGGDKGGQKAAATDPIIDDCTSGTIIENEKCTAYGLHALVAAEFMYSLTSGNGEFGSLTQLHDALLINPRIATGTYRGFVTTVSVFGTSGPVPASFHLNAAPQTYGTTGKLSFYIDSTGVLRAADHSGGPATAGDPPYNF